MDKVTFLGNGIEPLLRILIVGSIACVGVILALGVSGKRPLLRMSTLDLALKMVLGLAFGFVLTEEQLSLSNVLVIFVLLVSFQFFLSRLETRPEKLTLPTAGNVALLYYKGRFLEWEMKKMQVQQAEVLAAAEKSLIDMSEVEAVILEKSRKLTFIKKPNKGGHIELPKQGGPD